MPHKKELMHVAGNGYRVTSKTLDIHQSTDRQIVYKWSRFGTVATFHRSGPAKISSKAQRRKLKEVKQTLE